MSVETVPSPSPTDLTPNSCDKSKVPLPVIEKSDRPVKDTAETDDFYPLYDDISQHQETVQKAQQMLKEVYIATDVFVSVDPDTIVYQDIGTDPYLGAAGRLATIREEIEEMRESIEYLSSQVERLLPPSPCFVPTHFPATTYLTPFEGPPPPSYVPPPRSFTPRAPAPNPKTKSDPRTNPVPQPDSTPPLNSSQRRHRRRRRIPKPQQ